MHIIAGNLFAISDAQGDIETDPQAPARALRVDTRFLSHWVLRIDGERINALSRDDITYFETRFFLVPGAASHYVDADVSIIRHRSIDDSFHEQITVLNHSPQPAEFTVRMEIASDFADIAEIGQPGSAPSGHRRLGEPPARLRYERDRFARETTVSSTAPVEVDEGGMTFRIRIAPDGKWETDLHVSMTIRGEGGRDMRADLESHQQRVRRDARGPGGLAGPGAAAGGRARRAGGDVPGQPGRPGRAALQAAVVPGGCRSGACRGRWRCAAGTA